MQARDPHVIQPHDLISQNGCSEGGLLGHRNVAGAAGGNHDLSDPIRLEQRADDAAARVLVVIQRMRSAHNLRSFLGQPGDKDGLLPILLHRPGNAGDLFGRLACAVDDLCYSLAQLAVSTFA